MIIVSSHISITNRVEEASLYLYNGRLTGRFERLRPLLLPIEQQVFSRIVGLLISPAALLEIAIHVTILPFIVIYSIGRSVYLRQCDFVLPLDHIQRIRDAVFPALFGSLFGLIHPYLGTYAAEPVKKHIASGILLSGTDKAQFDSVCSPVTTIQEVSSLLSQLPAPYEMSHIENKLLKQVSFWEQEFEKIQSIDFFNLNLTFKVSEIIQQAIDGSNMPSVIKVIATRVSLITYPIFMALDLVVFLFATTVSLGVLAVKLLGGQSPAYLENACSAEVLIYNIVKIPLFIISATIGFVVSLVNPRAGLLCIKYPMEGMAKIPFLLKMLGLKFRLNRMGVGEMILLPTVQSYPGDQFNLLPSKGSHMRYLLIEKVNENEYQAELIERHNKHGKTPLMTLDEMNQTIQRTLALRYLFGNQDKEILDFFNDRHLIVDLGSQPPHMNNCVITNLFATLEVLHHRRHDHGFAPRCNEVKNRAALRYYMYASDFYPFGRTDEVIEEVNRLMQQKI